MIVPKKEPEFKPAFLGFTYTAEIWNSRACMIGLIGSFIVELVSSNSYGSYYIYSEYLLKQSCLFHFLPDSQQRNTRADWCWNWKRAWSSSLIFIFFFFQSGHSNFHNTFFWLICYEISKSLHINFTYKHTYWEQSNSDKKIGKPLIILQWMSFSPVKWYV